MLNWTNSFIKDAKENPLTKVLKKLQSWVVQRELSIKVIRNFCAIVRFSDLLHWLKLRVISYIGACHTLPSSINDSSTPHFIEEPKSPFNFPTKFKRSIAANRASCAISSNGFTSCKKSVNQISTTVVFNESKIGGKMWN